MNTRQKLQDRGINLNTILILLSILTAGITVSRFAGPIFDGPAKTAAVEQQLARTNAKMTDIQSVQLIQTEALKTLANVAADTKETRDKVIRHDSELDDVRRRLDRVEAK